MLLKNGIPCSFDDQVDGGDQLTVQKGEDGVRPELTLGDLIGDLPSKMVIINGQRYEASAKMICNNLPASMSKPVEDRDEIIFEMPDTIESILKELNLAEMLNDTRPFLIKIDGIQHKVTEFMGKMFVNGLEAKLQTKIDHLDDIRFEKGKEPTLRRLVEKLGIPASESMPIFFNGQQVQLEQELIEFSRRGIKLGMDERIHSGDLLTTKQKDVQDFIFQDLFKFVHFDIPKDSRGFTLLKNGEKAAFDDRLAAGDELNITFENPIVLK